MSRDKRVQSLINKMKQSSIDHVPFRHGIHKWNTMVYRDSLVSFRHRLRDNKVFTLAILTDNKLMRINFKGKTLYTMSCD